MFRDRVDAGLQLAGRLLVYADEDPLIFGLPRTTSQPELALGAVTDGDRPQVTLNQHLIDALGVEEEYLETEAQRQLAEVHRRIETYRRGRPAADARERTAIIIDDGIATGATVQAGILGVRRTEPRRIILAVPVAAPDAVERLEAHVDEVVCLHAPEDFMAVGLFYQSFTQTSDEEVMQLLDRFQEEEEKR